MPPRAHAWPLLLLAAACFNPASPHDTGDTGAGTTGPAPDTTSAPDPTTTDPITTTSTTSTTSTSAAPTTGATTGDPTTGGCDACPDTAPYCVDDTCVDCQGLPGGCPSLDAPYCASDGLCVACLDEKDCASPTGICDPSTRTCVGCTEHSQCPDGACELDVGQCFPPTATTLFVEVGQTCAMNPCTVDQPCCSLAEAINQAPAADYLIVRVTAFNDVVDTSSLLLDQPGRRLAILGENQPNWSSPNAFNVVLDGQSAPDPADGGKLYLAGLRMLGVGAAAVSCSRAAALWLDDVTIVDVTTAPAVSINDHCPTTLRRSALIGNQTGVSAFAVSALRIADSILADSPMFAVVVADTPVEISYSTLIARDDDLLLGCDATAAVELHNAVALSVPSAGKILCTGSVAIDHSALSDDILTPAATDSVFLLDADIPDQFPLWSDRDYHVADQGGLLAGVARWRPGDSVRDIDGDERPASLGAADVAGADHPAP